MTCIHQVGPASATRCSPTCNRRNHGTFSLCDGNPACPQYEEWDGRYGLVACARLVCKLRLGYKNLTRHKHPHIRDHPCAVKAKRGA